MPNAFIYDMDGEKTLLPKGKLSEHFYRKEFDCQCGCGTGKINPILVQRLEVASREYGQPMRINSGLRCLSHNRKIGSRDTSSHIKGLAADIGCVGMDDRHKLLTILLKFFKRVGVNKNFIHVDVDSDKPNGAFVY